LVLRYGPGSFLDGDTLRPDWLVTSIYTFFVFFYWFKGI
jgi:hypothetical protein